MKHAKKGVPVSLAVPFLHFAFDDNDKSGFLYYLHF